MLDHIVASNFYQLKSSVLLHIDVHCKFDVLVQFMENNRHVFPQADWEAGFSALKGMAIARDHETDL